jgi:hypothetical protein
MSNAYKDWKNENQQEARRMVDFMRQAADSMFELAYNEPSDEMDRLAVRINELYGDTVELFQKMELIRSTKGGLMSN